MRQSVRVRSPVDDEASWVGSSRGLTRCFIHPIKLLASFVFIFISLVPSRYEYLSLTKNYTCEKDGRVKEDLKYFPVM